MSKSSMVVAFTLFLSPSVAAQTTIYSTFGPGDSYAQNTGYALLGVQWIAAPFTYTGTSGDFLFDFRVGIAADGNITASFWVGNDMNTATVLESWNIFAPRGIQTFTSVLNPTLSNGQVYWVMLSVTEPTSSDWPGWALNDQQLSGAFEWSADSGENWTPSSQLLPAFDVRVASGELPGATVPEPATMTLLATGLAGIAASRRRQRPIP